MRTLTSPHAKQTLFGHSKEVSLELPHNFKFVLHVHSNNIVVIGHRPRTSTPRACALVKLTSHQARDPQDRKDGAPVAVSHTDDGTGELCFSGFVLEFVCPLVGRNNFKQT